MGRPRSQFNYILVLTFSDVHLKYQKCGRPPYHNSLNIPSDEHCCLLFHFLFVSLRGETSNSHGIHHSKWRTMPPNFGTVETCDVVKTKRNDPWPMTGNGNHTTCQNGHDWGMVQMALPTCAVFWLKTLLDFAFHRMPGMRALRILGAYEAADVWAQQHSCGARKNGHREKKNLRS